MLFVVLYILFTTYKDCAYMLVLGENNTNVIMSPHPTRTKAVIAPVSLSYSTILFPWVFPSYQREPLYVSQSVAYVHI